MAVSGAVVLVVLSIWGAASSAGEGDLDLIMCKKSAEGPVVHLVVEHSSISVLKSSKASFSVIPISAK